jgi:hypothetical protein
MAASSQQVASFGRIAVYGNVSVIKVSVSANATVYSTAAGGLPIDLLTVLQQAAPASLDNLNPNDIVDIYAVGLSANGYLPGGFALGVPTYVNKPGVSQQSQSGKVLASCPATLRLYGIGASSANHAALGEVADGAVTDTINFHLVVARGGENF